LALQQGPLQNLFQIFAEKVGGSIVLWSKIFSIFKQIRFRRSKARRNFWKWNLPFQNL